MSTPPIFDPQFLDDICQWMPPQELKDYIDLLAPALWSRIEIMRTLHTHGDFKELKIIAHAIAGVGSCYGLLKIRDLSKIIEFHEAKPDEHPAKLYEDIIVELYMILEPSLQAVDSWFIKQQDLNRLKKDTC